MSVRIRPSLVTLAGLFISLILPLAVRAEAPAAATAASPTQARASDRETVILFIGDSLTEGYGVKREEAYPEVAGRILVGHGAKVKIINGGISGSVTADADRRVKWFIKAKPDILFLAMGANDGLKGTPAEVIKKNLAQAIDLAQANNITVVLAGLKLFSNFGAEYSKQFEKLYADLARGKKLQFMPFLLEGVALDKKLNQSDMKHPNPEGAKVVGANVAQELMKTLAKVNATPERK